MLCIAAATVAHSALAAPLPHLCTAGERIVFACKAKTKLVSLCAQGDLTSPTGVLTYRFGKPGLTPELTFSSSPGGAKKAFSYTDEGSAKTTSIDIGFKRAGYAYHVYHTQEADGSAAGVNVFQGNKEIAAIVCHERSAVDNTYDEMGRKGFAEQ